MTSFELAILVVTSEVRYQAASHLVFFALLPISLGFGQGYNPVHVIEFMIS